LISAGGLLVVNSAANISMFFGAPAVLGLVVSVFNGAGRPILGILFDKYGRGNAMRISSLTMILGGASLICGALTDSAAFVFIGLPIIGICYGGVPSLSSAAVSAFYGSKHYPVNFAASTFQLMPAAIIGPLVSSKLQEASSGSYDSTFIMLLTLAICALIVNTAVTVRAKKERLEWH
jgi:OFA family oxalate/formate antiporter-like MFS transporter